MSQAPSMPMFVDALIGDTLHLSAEEFGAYCLVLFATWRNNGRPLPDDDRKLARVCRVSVWRWRHSFREKLLPFFNVEDGSWRQKRLEKEWNFVQKLSESQRKKGIRSGAVRRLKSNGTGGTEARTQSEPEANPHTYIEDSVLSSEDANASPEKRTAADAAAQPIDPVKDLWDRGLAILGEKHRSLLGKFVKTHGQPAVLGAIVECEREQPVEPAAYFIRCCEERSKNGNGGDPYAILAQAAINFDERQGSRRDIEAAH